MGHKDEDHPSECVQVDSAEVLGEVYYRHIC